MEEIFVFLHTVPKDADLIPACIRRMAEEKGGDDDE